MGGGQGVVVFLGMVEGVEVKMVVLVVVMAVREL